MRRKLDYHGGKHAKRWATWRDLIITTCKAKCRNFEICGRKADFIDHILPFAEGGTDNYYNLQPICNKCHEVKSANENRARAKLMT
jgi:5-methylcytosine-specific restriction enzyme A